MKEYPLCMWISLAVVISIITSLIFLLKKYLQGGQYKKPTKITNKVVLITGANTGIGKETALDLASRGAKVYLACRDYERGEAARLDIIAKTRNENVFNRKLDLASFESIKTFCEAFKCEENQLDILINNAGYLGNKRLTKDNFEMCIGVNHLGHFLLTNLLIDILKNAAPSRIIVLTCMGHANGTINREDLNSEKSYSIIDSYCQSKLANVLFTRHLSGKLTGTGVAVNSSNPGTVDSGIFRNIPRIFSPFMSFGKWFFFKTAKSGAQTTIRLAVDPAYQYITGKYFSDCKERKCAKEGMEDETAEWLWNKSEELTGVKYSNVNKN